MNSHLTRFLIRLGQYRYPAEFRIESGAQPSPLAEIISRITARGGDDKPGTPPAETLKPDFIVALCNYYFRLNRNIRKIEESGQEVRELSKMKRAIADIQYLLDEHQVELKDLTGEIYDVGRGDFETLGEPIEKPGMDQMRIHLCERPVVRMNGKLLQKAKGVVARPA